MFLQYYGLREQPFGTTPDPRLLYLSDSHREALASLVYGIEAGRGFMALIAEPGMGKTTLLFQLMERLRSSARTVFLFQTQGSTREFFCNLIADLGLEPGDQDVSSLQRQLNEILIREAQMGKQFVLIIDEAQNLKDPVLESVRMLSNFETPRSKLMQIILAGQPALADKLARPEFEQLRQRVSILCRLDSLTKEEVADYIKHRLAATGYKGDPLFTPEALSIIAEQSRGIPRNINNLCFHALSIGYAKGLKRIDRAIMMEVLVDLNLDNLRTPRSTPTSPSESRQAQDARFDLGSVTLGGRSQVGKRAGGLYGGVYSLPSSQETNKRRRRSSKRQTSQWLVLAVVLPLIILVGEVFWAYLPPDVSQGIVSKSLSAVVREAEQIAGKHDLLGSARASGSHALTKPQRNVVDSNDQAPGQAQQINSSEAADSVNSDPARPPSVTPSAPDSVDPGKNADPAATAHAASAIVQTPNKKAKKALLRSSSENAWSSAGVEKTSVVVECNINGGQITINGKTQPDWKTPHAFSLPLGAYRISVSKSGYSTWFREVQVFGGSKRWIMADLRLPRGVVVIETEPPGMQVFIDGKPYGPSEVETALNAGTHSFEVIPPSGYQPVSGTFVLKPGNVLARKITVLPSASQPDADNRGGPLPWKHGANANDRGEKS